MSEASLRLRGWKARLVVVFLSLSPFFVLEVVLWIVGYRPAAYRNLAPESPVFETDGRVVRVIPARRRQFRTQPFGLKKAPGTLRIFAVGDSVTWGPLERKLDTLTRAYVPAPMAYPDILEEMLGQRYPDRSFEVINCGGCGYGSYRLQYLVRELLQYSPDMIVLMCGSNEYIEARYYKDWEAFRAKGATWLQHWKSLVLGRDLLRVAMASRPRRPVLTAPTVPIIDEDIIEGPEVMKAILEHSAQNLSSMAEACRAAGVTLLLCIQASNLHKPPTAPKRQTEADEELWELLRATRKLIENDKNREASELLKGALPRFNDSPAFGALCFAVGVSLERLGKFDEAREYFKKARDLDPFPARASGAFNDAVRRIAQQPGVFLVDVERAFEQRAEHGITGDEFFFDSCHVRPDSLYIIAEAVCKVIEDHRLIE